MACFFGVSFESLGVWRVLHVGPMIYPSFVELSFFSCKKAPALSLRVSDEEFQYILIPIFVFVVVNDDVNMASIVVLVVFVCYLCRWLFGSLESMRRMCMKYQYESMKDERILVSDQ